MVVYALYAYIFINAYVQCSPQVKKFFKAVTRVNKNL